MKKRGILKKVLITIFILIAAVIGFLIFTINKSSAQLSGELKVEGLLDEVTVKRDSKGVPTIIAKNDADLYFAQGFIQAQDRLFQMDLARRQASGRLAEIVGEAAIENDKKFLLFDLRRSAERSLSRYSKEALEVINNFVNGVNTFIKYAKENDKLPYEFRLLGYEPEDWNVIDSLTIGKYMAYDLGGHYESQVFNNWAINNLGEEIFVELNKEAVAKDDDIKELIEINKEYKIKIDKKMAQIEHPPVYNGSNNWVLAGSKTESGKPLIADDPHLSLSTPSIWYQMVLISPTQKVSGVIFAGIPGIILGNNENIAWVVTNYGPDVQDLFIEKRNPENSNQFELDNKFYDGEIVEHEIKVKGKDAIKFDLEYTKNGIIVDDLIKVENPNISISMKWTAHDATSEFEAILGINKAANWTEFEKALESFESPAQNFIFADKEGNIGFKSNGNIPIRKKGNALLLVPGFDSSFGWDGYISFDKLPREYNPEKGYLATANIETGKNLDYHTSNIFAQPYRMNRINEVLSQDKKFNVQDMKDLQMDIKNLSKDEFLDDFLNNVDQSNIDSKILESLKNWDGFDNKEDLAPLVFNKWLYNTSDYIFKNIMNEDEFKFMKYKDYYGHNLLRQAFAGNQVKLFEKLGGLKTILENSYKEVIENIKSEQGSNIDNWNWGKAHKLYLKHPLSQANPVLDALLTPKKVEMSGSRYTVMAAKENDKGFVNHGASWRFVYDFSTNVGEHIVAPGQSGHFMSKNYSDQVMNWVDGVYNSVNLSDIKEDNVLKLLPR